MSVSLQFRVNTIPVAQPRQRHAYNKNIGRVINYIKKDDPVNSFKYAVQAKVIEEYGINKPLDIPLEVRFHFVFPRPKKYIWKKREMPPLPHTSKPDFDNLAKSTCDALNGILWTDDALICKATIIKTIASGTETPHVYISVCDYQDYPSF